MMMVGGVAGSAPAQRATRRSAAGQGFALPQADAAEVAETADTGAAAAVALGGMLFLQEEDGPEIRDRRARRHGQAMLKELGQLQTALLGGAADGEALRRLSALAGTVPEAADPMLGSLVRSVALRARVELARREAPLVA